MIDIRTVVRTEAVMGTVVTFTVRPGLAGADAVATGLDAAVQLLRSVDETFSTWRPDSPVSRLRRGELVLGDAPAEVREVLRLCRLARAGTAGWFDPWAMPGGVDPTGLVKGWAAERASAVLRAAGVGGALVNAGGDLAGFGGPDRGGRWVVGVRHPWRPDHLACVLAVEAAVATSGPYERALQLVDPRTGRAPTGVASATVTGPSLSFADAYATALAVGGDDVLDVLAGLDGYDAYLVRDDGSEAWTDGMPFDS